MKEIVVTMLAATLGLTADTQDFAASHRNEILSLTEKTIVPVQLGSEWILVPGSPKDGWTDRIPARNRFNRNFAECFFGLPELDLDSVVYGFGNEPELAGTKLSPWLGNAPRNGDILEIWHTFNEIDRLYVYIDDCFSSNDGMLFVLSWPNRPKGQTNNKRKGEKYGNWSYSYHRW